MVKVTKVGHTYIITSPLPASLIWITSVIHRSGRLIEEHTTNPMDDMSTEILAGVTHALVVACIRQGR